jgi:hypothetical protein
VKVSLSQLNLLKIRRGNHSYSKEFVRREDTARVARSISAIQVTTPRPKPSPRHASEEEEKEASSDDEAEEDNEGQDESEFDNPFPFPRHPWDPIKEARCIAVASCNPMGTVEGSHSVG